MNEKILTLLGFARKAGRLAVGTQATTTSIERGKACLALVAGDISGKSAKEIRFLCDKKSIKFAVLPFDTYDITKAIGTRAGIIAVEDDGFAQAIAEKL